MPEPSAEQNLTREFFNSWDRHTRILNSLYTLIGPDECELKNAADGSTIFEYLCHIHNCRKEWLSHISPQHAAALGNVYERRDDGWHIAVDLDEIKRQLAVSAAAVGEATRQLVSENATRVPPYDHPVHFLQHMLWHEAGHYSGIMLSLRIAGKEPPEEWEEKHVWGVWRDPE